MNEQQLRNLFSKLNVIYFKNQLPPPNHINLKFVKKYYGQFCIDNPLDWNAGYYLNFSSAFQFTEFEYEKIMIHEMIHVWQYKNNYPLNHRRTFKQKASELNRITNNIYEIDTYTKIENPISLKDLKKPEFEGFIIVYKYPKEPSKIYISKCASEIALKRFKRWVPNSTKIYDVHCYYVKGKIYNNFKNSIKYLNGIEFTKDSFEKEIDPTIMFENIDF